MTILFPDHPMRPGAVDPSFVEEREAAIAEGFPCALFSHEKLLAGDALRATSKVPAGDGKPCWMRGWMFPQASYLALSDALRARGHLLIVDAEAYGEAHYLPLAYAHLAGYTPQTVWTESEDVAAALEAYATLADGDVIVKDWVKSAKHRWDEACFIPAGASRERVTRTLAALRVERGRLFERGYVFRRYVPLVTTGRDMRGHPISEEIRFFYLDGDVLVSPLPGHGAPAEVMKEVGERARRFRSRFLTIDVAPTLAGGWTIIESGDAGVSGLPVSMLPETFYKALRERLGNLGGRAD